MLPHFRRARVLALLALASCAPVVSSGPADVVLLSGVVHTMDPAAPTAEAIAVRGGRVIAVGTNAEIEASAGPDTVIEELGGRAVLPGFVDAHTHLVWGGEDLEIIDLSDAATMDELLGLVSDYADANPTEAWVQGYGWDAPTFEGQMDRSLLDAIVPDRPVYLASADGHSAWVNSAALDAAGITADTPDPDGGAILHDDTGEPDGVLRETAMDLVYDLVPDFTDTEIDAGLQAALAEAHSYGITTVIDANAGDEVLAAYLRADAAGTLGLHVYGAIEAVPEEDASQVADIAAQRDALTSANVHIDAVKVYLDGVIESETAYMLEPYTDGTNGEQLFSDDALDAIFAAADAAGLQVHCHAIGDGAVRQVLDAAERAGEAPGGWDRRTLAAHIEVIDPVDVPRFAELGVYADFQPLWASPDPYIVDLTIPEIGTDRAEWLYPIGDVAASGATIVAGSDWDVSSMNPLEAMEVAITRQDPEEPALALTPDERVDLPTILAAYTSVGARAVFGEDDLGTISVGKYADLVVLDQDPFAIDATALSDVRVVSTWFEGAPVYRQASAR